MRKRRIELTPPFGGAPQLALGIEQRRPHILQRLGQATKFFAPHALDREIQILTGDAPRGARQLPQGPGDVNAVEVLEREPTQAAVRQNGHKPRRKREDPRHRTIGRR